jgi:hypothetical protein
MTAAHAVASAPVNAERLDAHDAPPRDASRRFSSSQSASETSSTSPSFKATLARIVRVATPLRHPSPARAFEKTRGSGADVDVAVETRIVSNASRDVASNASRRVACFGYFHVIAYIGQIHP